MAKKIKKNFEDMSGKGIVIAFYTNLVSILAHCLRLWALFGGLRGRHLGPLGFPLGAFRGPFGHLGLNAILVRRRWFVGHPF